MVSTHEYHGQIDPTNCSLLLTEPCFNLPNVAQHYDQMIFEEYEFASYSRCPGAALVPYGNLPASDQDVDGPYDQGALPRAVLVVDAGYSFTHIVPVLAGAVQWDAVQRIDVGGKLLTNYLKELISYRQWNVMDQTYVINAAKEACCYVSTDFRRDQDLCKSVPSCSAGADRLKEKLTTDMALAKTTLSCNMSYQTLHQSRKIGKATLLTCRGRRPLRCQMWSPRQKDCRMACSPQFRPAQNRSLA